jgi:hypothetical protein
MNSVSSLPSIFSLSVSFWSGPGSSVGIVTELRAGRSGDQFPVDARFSARPDLPWGLSSFLYNGYRVFPGGKMRPGRATDPSPPSSAKVLEEYSYISTSLWATTGTVTVLLYLISFWASLTQSVCILTITNRRSVIQFVQLPAYWNVLCNALHVPLLSNFSCCWWEQTPIEKLYMTCFYINKHILRI